MRPVNVENRTAGDKTSLPPRDDGGEEEEEEEGGEGVHGLT